MSRKYDNSRPTSGQNSTISIKKEYESDKVNGVVEKEAPLKQNYTSNTKSSPLKTPALEEKTSKTVIIKEVHSQQGETSKTVIIKETHSSQGETGRIESKVATDKISNNPIIERESNKIPEKKLAHEKKDNSSVLKTDASSKTQREMLMNEIKTRLNKSETETEKTKVINGEQQISRNETSTSNKTIVIINDHNIPKSTTGENHLVTSKSKIIDKDREKHNMTQNEKIQQNQEVRVIIINEKSVEKKELLLENSKKEFQPTRKQIQVAEGLAKTRLSQLVDKSSEKYVSERKLVEVHDQGQYSENQPIERTDAVIVYSQKTDKDHDVRGITKNMRERLKKKESEEYQVKEKHIVIVEGEGKIVENNPVRRTDVLRECDGDKTIHVEGLAKQRLSQLVDKKSEKYVNERKLVEVYDQGQYSENHPIERTDALIAVYSPSSKTDKDLNFRGITKSMARKLKRKESEEYQPKQTYIVIVEGEGEIVENIPVKRTDVFREDDYIYDEGQYSENIPLEHDDDVVLCDSAELNYHSHQRHYHYNMD